MGQLLARFYLPTSGDILIDGRPIQTLNINWIRNNITVVEQRSILFNESILKNIAFGRRDHDSVGKEDVQECLDLAMLQNIIDTMPNGLNTCVGQGGNFLSGGQRQRVAIARARLRDSPVLILDEPTSALDGTNCVEIIKAIRKWRRGKTTIIITHELSQILDNDFAYILEQGSIVQAGYRSELERGPEFEKYFPLSERPSRLSKYRGPSITNSGEKETWFSSDTSSMSSLEGYDNSKPPDELPLDTNREQGIGLIDIPLHELDLTQRKEPPHLLQDYHPSTTHAILRKQSTRRDRSSFVGRKPSRLSKERHITSLRQIMLTIIPSLTARQRIYLSIGCLCTVGHACATPVFSYCLSALLQTFYDTHSSAMKWALIVLAVSIGDGLVSYYMHYFLELCGQAWVDHLRKQAFRRVLDQPKKWFEEDENSPSQLTTCLGQDAEEMRNLVGRFGGFVLLAVAISVMAIIWSLAVCWKLTLIALACGPVIYTITRGFEATNGLWETRCNKASTVASEIFVETFAEIRTVRTLTLEPFFHQKYLGAASKCTADGIRKAFYTGFIFGLVESMVMFVSGGYSFSPWVLSPVANM